MEPIVVSTILPIHSCTLSIHLTWYSSPSSVEQKGVCEAMPQRRWPTALLHPHRLHRLQVLHLPPVPSPVLLQQTLTNQKWQLLLPNWSHPQVTTAPELQPRWQGCLLQLPWYDCAMLHCGLCCFCCLHVLGAVLAENPQLRGCRVRLHHNPSLQCMRIPVPNQPAYS